MPIVLALLSRTGACPVCKTAVIYKHAAKRARVLEQVQPWTGSSSDTPKLQTRQVQHNISREMMLAMQAVGKRLLKHCGIVCGYALLASLLCKLLCTSEHMCMRKHTYARH